VLVTKVGMLGFCGYRWAQSRETCPTCRGSEFHLSECVTVSCTPQCQQMGTGSRRHKRPYAVLLTVQSVRPGTLRLETPHLLMQLKQDRHTCTVGFSTYSVHSAWQNVRATQNASSSVPGQILEQTTDFLFICIWGTWHSINTGY